jgi:hypothetical protein
MASRWNAGSTLLQWGGVQGRLSDTQDSPHANWRETMNVPITQPCTRDQFDALRQRFKLLCTESEQRFQNWQIRVHRSLSWLERAIDTDPDGQPDGRLLYGWIAFNALYGRWDEATGFPAADTEAWQEFLKTTIAWDESERIGRQIQHLRAPILALLENQFVDPRFWRNPDQPGNTRRRYHEALSLFVERRWVNLAILAIERVYAFRGQLVHGAATRGSELNRLTLQQCREVLEGLLMPIMNIVIERGCHDNWPPLCYPPIRSESPEVMQRPSSRLPR